MDTRELTSFMTGHGRVTEKYFGGVVACDELPQRILKNNQPIAFIINTDPKTLPGQHWLAVFITEKRSGEFFDSYGNPPDYKYFPKSIYRFLQRNCVKISYNTRQVQDLFSTTCGQHCLFFLLQRCKGNSFTDIIHSMYSDDLRKNDVLVSRFVKKLPHHHHPRNVKHVFKCTVQCVCSGEMFFKKCHSC